MNNLYGDLISEKDGIFMPEHKNLLRRIVYDEPFSKTCYKKVLGVKVPYPCFGMKRKKLRFIL